LEYWDIEVRDKTNKQVASRFPAFLQKAYSLKQGGIRFQHSNTPTRKQKDALKPLPSRDYQSLAR
jgi:hypothetical protein